VAPAVAASGREGDLVAPASYRGVDDAVDLHSFEATRAVTLSFTSATKTFMPLRSPSPSSPVLQVK